MTSLTSIVVVRDYTGNVCGFSRTDGCVELSQADPQAPRLAQTEAECKAINSQVPYHVTLSILRH